MTSAARAPDDGRDPTRGERLALGITATGLLVLDAPTGLQVAWLIGAAVGAVALVRHRPASRPEPDAGGDGDDRPPTPT